MTKRMYITVKIDLEQLEDNLDDMGSLRDGVYGVNKEGIYHLFYHKRNTICEFLEYKEEYLEAKT